MLQTVQSYGSSGAEMMSVVHREGVPVNVHTLTGLGVVHASIIAQLAAEQMLNVISSLHLFSKVKLPLDLSE